MNSTRRRWQTTGSRAPGATLGLRRRAAAMAPTNLATLCVCVCLCVFYLPVCITWSALIVCKTERRNEKVGRTHKTNIGEKTDWWVQWWVCIQYVSMFIVFVCGRVCVHVCIHINVFRNMGWESRTANERQWEQIHMDTKHMKYEQHHWLCNISVGWRAKNINS